MFQHDEQQWASRTFASCRFRDRRHRRRLIRVGTCLAQRPAASLSAACGDDEAARLGGYRLIENDRVDAEAIAEGGFVATVNAGGDAARLLAASDTTTLCYPHETAKALGDVGGPAHRGARGWLVHSSLLIDGSNQMAIGLIDQQWRVRSWKGRGRKHQRKSRPYTEKESFKWQATSERLADRLGERMAPVIELCDAEADIYEYLTYKVGHHQRFVVRIAQDRRVLTSGGLSDADEKLWANLEQQPALGTRVVTIPQRGGRAAREATLTLRSATVTLHPPWRADGVKLVPLSLQAVLVEEMNPPKGVEPLRWRLYTSEPTQTLKQGQQVVDDYSQRWQVEEFHKAWKSGCKVEDQRQQTPENLRRMAQIRAFVAVRLLQLKQHAAFAPERSCHPLLNTTTWKCLWLSVEKRPLPEMPPTQRWALQAVARLGGWNDSKRTGRPGWVALVQGWQELQARIAGYQLALAAPL